MLLLSIVVPTSDRPGCAASCVRSLARIASTAIEVVVQDNSDRDDLRALLESVLADPRIRYFHPPDRVSMSENWERGVGQARGEYVTVLGDDDGINPDLVEAVAWARSNDVDALTPSKSSVYFWPDFRQKYYGNRAAGTLVVFPFSGTVSEQDVEAGVRRASRGAFQNLSDATDLPKVYYGVVRRCCLEGLRNEAGTYFPGVSPDMAAAIGLTKYVRRLVSMDYPLFLPGASARSNSGIFAAKQRWPKPEEFSDLRATLVASWPACVPRISSAVTIWAESGVRALQAIGRADVIAECDFGLLHAMAAVFRPSQAFAAVTSYYRWLRSVDSSLSAGTVRLIAGVVQVWRLRLSSLLKRFVLRSPSAGFVVARGLDNIESAVGTLSEYLAGSVRSTAPWREVGTPVAGTPQSTSGVLTR